MIREELKTCFMENGRINGFEYTETNNVNATFKKPVEYDIPVNKTIK